jgi:lipoprotein-anchoring transpeptidase ErfK/SrfK
MLTAKDMKVLAVIAALAIATPTAFLLFGSGSTSPAAAVVVTLPTVTAPPAALPPPEAPQTTGPVKRPTVKGPTFPIATVAAGHRIALHVSPAGTVFEQAGDRTEFGSPRAYWIERVQGQWLGVPTPDLPNGKLAWIYDDRSDLTISQTHFWIAADLSTRRVELHYAKRTLEQFPVSVGSETSPTPLGNYAVTDGLNGGGIGPWYGCCILALSGHQESLPAGWIGGNRIAIHGTPGSVGRADSHGCLRASNSDMASLFARVPLGTPVFIRA